MQPKILIKGIREGLLVTLGEGTWPEVHQALLEQLDQQQEFLRGARLAVDIGNQVLKAVEMSQLRNEILERELTLWAVLSNSPTSIQTAQTLGLATRIGKPRSEGFNPRSDVQTQEGEPALFVQRTLRSGVSLKHAGHVVLVGDLNPGAEIIASGNVIVWGRLRGMVHAGAGGNTQAIVCALDLSPTQLRIADEIAMPPRRRGKPQPEMAHVQDGHVIAEPWNPKKP